MIRPRYGWPRTIIIVLVWAAVALAIANRIDTPVSLIFHAR